jgi:Spore Coat Protein U domain
MKKLVVHLVAVASAVSALLTPVVADAATVSSGFNVTVQLTAACEITSAPTDVAFTYTSFQAAAATATPGAFSVRCTNSLPYSLALDASAGTVIGLAYTLGLSLSSNVGNGAAQAYTISGGMVANQSGTCATTPPGTCSGSDPRTLTITY